MVIVIIGDHPLVRDAGRQRCRAAGRGAATQSLITKLEGGLNDRLDALMQNRPDAELGTRLHGGGLEQQRTARSRRRSHAAAAQARRDRAQVFAWYDYLKSELPDVFFLQNDPNYPINFAVVALYPGTADPLMSPNGGYANYMLPLGNSISESIATGSYGDDDPRRPAYLTNPTLGFTGAGIFGASYPIAAGLFKNLPGIVQPTGLRRGRQQRQQPDRRDR